MPSGSMPDAGPQRDARGPQLGQRDLAVAGLQVDRGDGVGQEVGLVAEPGGVERRGLDAVVGREADDDDALDGRDRAAAASSAVGRS